MCCPNCSEHVLEQNGYKYLQNASDQSQSIYFSKNFSPPFPYQVHESPPPPPSPNTKSCMNPRQWDNDFFLFGMEIFQDQQVSSYHPPRTKNPVRNPVKLQAYDWLQVCS